MMFENVVFLAKFLEACNNVFVKGVVLAIAMDTFLGCLRAAKFHKWNSSVGIDGGIRKAGMLVSVFFLVLVDMLLHFNALGCAAARCRECWPGPVLPIWAWRSSSVLCM